MRSPYLILGVTEQASDNDIKQAYLQKVKQFPPDHHHEQFQEIQQAYQLIKDFSARTKYALFNIQVADFNVLLDQAFNVGCAPSLSADHFEKLLRASIDSNTYKIAAPETAQTL